MQVLVPRFWRVRGVRTPRTLGESVGIPVECAQTRRSCIGLSELGESVRKQRRNGATPHESVQEVLLEREATPQSRQTRSAAGLCGRACVVLFRKLTSRTHLSREYICAASRPTCGDPHCSSPAHLRRSPRRRSPDRRDPSSNCHRTPALLPLSLPSTAMSERRRHSSQLRLHRMAAR